jgi:outer membrane autotransporter protein
MKKAFAFVAAMAATPAFAADLPVPGLSLDTEIKAEHLLDAGSTTLTLNPEINWQPMVDGPLNVSIGTTITAFDSTAGNSFAGDFIMFDTFSSGSRPNIELGATWALRENAELYAETEWDVDDGNRTELKLGVSFNF